jgi:hypothetical protein
MSGQIAVWRGVDPTTPFDVADVPGTSGSTDLWTPPAITTVTAGAWVVSAVATSDNNILAFGTANGFTARMTGDPYDTTAGSDHAVGLADIQMATPGTATMLQWDITNSPSDYYAGITFALRPAPITLTIAKPALTVQDDVMIASIGFRPQSGEFSSNITVTPPAGWTQLYFYTSTTNYNAMAVYYRVAGASEPPSYTWGFACNASCTFRSAAGGIVSFSGVDTTNPIDQDAGVDTPATYDPLTPSITTTVANAMLVTSHQIDNNDLWQDPPPSGLTQAFQQTTDFEMIQVSYGLQAAVGSTGQKQAHDNGPDGADVGNAHILALRPEVILLPPSLADNDARLFYGEGTVAAVQFRTWDDSVGSWSSEGDTPDANSTIKWTVNKIGRNADEELVGVLSDTGTGSDLDILRWNGTAWTVDWSSTAIANANVNKRGFDIEYEALSGDALVVYSNNTATPVFRTRSGGVWSAETALPLNDGVGPNPDPNSGTVLWVELERRPGTNEIALAYVDANSALVSIIWDGTQWVTASAATLESDIKRNPVTLTVSNRAFDLAYEETTGDLMVAWSRHTTSGFWYSTKAAGSNVWAAAAQVAAAPTNGIPHFIDLAAEPGGQRIAIGAFDLGDIVERLGLATWTGSAWVNAAEYDSQIRDVNDTATGDFAGAVGWVGTSGTAVAVYPDNQTGTIDWASWTAAGGWVLQTAVAVTGKGFTESVQIEMFDNQNKLMAIFSDSNSDLYAATYDGVTWTVTNSGSPLETLLSSIDSGPFSFAIKPRGADHMVVTATDGAAPAGGTEVLALQLVDAGGNPVSLGLSVTVTVTGSATFSANSIGGTNGSNTLSGTLSASGSGSVTITDTVAQTVTVSADATGDAQAVANVSANVTFSAGAPSQLVFVTQPSDGTAGVALPTQPVVEVRDALGNPVTTDPNGAATETVTVAFTAGTNGEGATLSGTLTVSINWATGRATFTNLSVNLGGSYQLTASTNLGAFTADSSAFSITAAIAGNSLETACYQGATGFTSVTTGSISPGANRLVLAWVSNRVSTVPTPTLSGNGLTWVQVNTVTTAANGTRLTLFRAMGPAPTAGSVTIDFGGIAVNRACWSIVQYDGVDTSGTNGSGAVVQSATNFTAATATSLTVTLGAFASASNVATGGFTGTALSTYANGSGFSIYGQAIAPAGLSIATEGLPANDPTVDISITTTATYMAGIAVELRQLTCASVSDAAYVAANAQSGQAILYWSSTNPAIILRKSGSAITDTPTNGTGYVAGNTIGASSVVYNGLVPDSSITEGSLTNGTSYYYKLFARTGTCYSPGIEVNARPEAGPTPAWSYMMSSGSTMRAGIAGYGSINTAGNFGRIISLDTADGTQMWAPVATTGAVQSWLSWLPVGSWSYRKTLTIDATKVGAGGVTDFPVLVSITDADLRDKAQADGDDIIFTASDGTTRLSHEIERYVSSTGELIAWVKVPSLSSAANTDIYMYYGNPSVGNQQDAAGVWSNGYVGVWHLKETTGGAGAIKDSTSNANHGTDANGPALGSAGQVGNAVSFDGVDDLVDLGTGSSLNVSYLTIDFWVKANSWVTDGGILAKGDDTYRQYWIWTYGGAVSFEVDEGTLQNSAWTPALGQWTHLALTYDGVNVTTYRNGVVENTYPQATGPIDAQAPSLKFGNIPGYSYANVALDEVRISSVSRSAAWITTEYNNQNSPSTFYTVGGEEPSTGGTVFAGDQSGRVYSVSTVSGATNWSVNLTGSGADGFQAPIAAQLRQWSDAAFQAAYTDDVLFVATRNASSTNNKLFALRASNGAVLWTFNGTGTYNVDYIVGMPWVDYARNRVYMVSRAGAAGTQSSLWVINSLNGTLVQSFALGHLEASPTMSYDGNTLYVGATNGDFYAYDLNSLTQKWWTALPDGVKGFVWEDWTTPGRLYLSTTGDQVRCLQDNGGWQNPVWTTAVAGASTPLPMDTVLYVGSSDGKVHQLRLSDGVDEKQFTVGTGAFAVGDVSTETLTEIFVPTTEGKLYKLPVPLP